MKRICLLVFILVVNTTLSGQTTQFPFQDNTTSNNERISDLLSRLTLEEKCSLLMYNSPAIERLNIEEYNWWNESLHGIGRAGKATVFPQAIGMAATFDPELIYRVADAISTEARAKYNAARVKGNRSQYAGITFWSPNVNIFRDPRWGRGQETYGEDPFLTSQMGIAYVKGLQGNTPGLLKTAACAKHFVVHSGPEESRHRFNAMPSLSDFHNTYAPAFKALVDAGVESVMCAYNRTFDEPCCGSSPLLKDLLRNQWGFKGHIVSDCWALDDIWLRHKVASSEVEAAAMAALAGMNLNCGYLYNFLPQAVEKNMIDETLVDSLLTPVLNTRLKLGMFDPDSLSPWNNLSPDTVNCLLHKQLAYKTAVESCVLLQNKNNVLPLNENTLKKIFITGPTAAEMDALLGNYNGFSGNLTTILEGIINGLNPGTLANYSRGCLLAGDTVFHGFWDAEGADVIIASLGYTRMLEGENGDAMLSKYGGDRRDLKLPENQLKFLHKMRDKYPETCIIVVLTGGSAFALEEIQQIADAILMAWYPGEQGGNAVADILFGRANPSGKLPITFYKSIDQLPNFDNYNMEGRTYRYFEGEPLYPFGYGLSYSTFNILECNSDRKKYSLSDTITVSVTIQNNSSIGGVETIQTYTDYPDNIAFAPIKSLIAFQRVFIPPNEIVATTLHIPAEQLKLYAKEEKSITVSKGSYEFSISTSSVDSDHKFKILIE